MDPLCVLRTSASRARPTRRAMASSRCRLPHYSRIRAPSLRRRCPASAVLQASPPPCRPIRPLAGFRLARATPPTGLPVLLRSPSSMRAAATTPAEPTGACVVRFPVDGGLPVRMAGQFPRLQFRGLLGVHSRCGPAWSLNRPRQPSLGAVQTMSLPPSCAPIAAGWNDRCWAASAPAAGHCVAGNRDFPIPGNPKLHPWRLRRPLTSTGGTMASRYLPPVGHGRSAERPHASRGSRMADATPCRHPQVDCNAIVA